MTALRLKPAPGLRYRAALSAYAALLTLGEPLVWRYLRKRALADPDYMAHAPERRARGLPFEADLWVHAVSLGEFTSARPLIQTALDAGYRVLTTHATPAGRRAAEAAFGRHRRFSMRYMPIDRPRYWRRFFKTHAPKVGLVMEVEFWPVMIEEARRARCALCLTNSQVPSKSLPRAVRLARWVGHPVARAAAVFAKSAPMAERFRDLGADPITVMGETRFDIPAPVHLVEAGRALKTDRPVLTLASVVAGEEEVYLDLVTRLMASSNPPLVIWVPRAPERFEDHAEMLEGAGFAVTRRSEAFSDDLTPLENLAQTQILIGNSLGEMFFYLAPADAVIVGGGFTEKGAHNVIEPLSLSKPVLTGPSIWTIEFPAVEAEEAGVLHVVTEPGDLPAAIGKALQSGAAAEAFHDRHKGASDRIFAAIKPSLDEGS